MGKILVKQAVEAQYPVGAGAPIFVLGGGERGGRARTLRESAGGLAGGLVGVLGALGGQQRSLGGLAQSAISGGAQGAALGRGLGRMAVGRVGQARADMREAGKQARAEERARLAEATRARGQGFGSMARIAEKRDKETNQMVPVMPKLAFMMNPAAYIRRKNYRAQEAAERERQQAERSSAASKDAQQQVSDYLVGQEKRRREGREKAMGTEEAQREMDAMRSDSEIGRNMKDIMSSMYGMSGSEINAAFQQGGAAARGGNTVRVVTTADGTPVADANKLAVQPANSRIGQAAPGSVNSGNESADPQGTQVNAAVGLNTDNEQVTPNAMQPPQGQEQLTNANEEAFEARKKLLEDLEERARETQQMMGAGEQSTLFRREE